MQDVDLYNMSWILIFMASNLFSYTTRGSILVVFANCYFLHYSFFCIKFYFKQHQKSNTDAWTNRGCVIFFLNEIMTSNNSLKTDELQKFRVLFQPNAFKTEWKGDILRKLCCEDSKNSCIIFHSVVYT